MTTAQPLVSVLITVYNGMPLLEQVIDHLLKQTYKNLEIIVVDDASTDDTPQYLSSLTNPEIKVFTPGKLGRGKALNYGLSKCSGTYVAINDADDLSMADRIRLQVDFMEQHPDYGLVGSNFTKVFSDQKKETTHKSLDNESLRRELSLHSCIQHSCVLFRKSILDRIGGYNLNIRFLYDRDIYIRVAAISKIANLQDNLVWINRHENQYFNKTFSGLKRQWQGLRYSFIAIRVLNLPRVLYLKRLFQFAYNTSIYLVKKVIQ